MYVCRVVDQSGKEDQFVVNRRDVTDNYADAFKASTESGAIAMAEVFADRNIDLINYVVVYEDYGLNTQREVMIVFPESH